MACQHLFRHVVRIPVPLHVHQVGRRWPMLWQAAVYGHSAGASGRLEHFFSSGRLFFCIFAVVKLDEAIERYMRYISDERRFAAGTVENYRRDLSDLAMFLEPYGIDSTEALTAREVRAWQMEHLERGEAAGTVRRRLASVGSWLRYLRRMGWMDTDIMAKVTPPKVPKRMPVFYKESETEHLYDAGLFDDDFWGRRDALMLRMLYETGVRRSELVGLKESSVDFDALTLKVLGKRNKERIVPIENELAHNISDYIALKSETVPGTEWLFVGKRGGKLAAEQVYTIVKRYMTGLTDADRVSPHVFRHSFATHILSEGGDLEAIRQLLGHESLSTTEVYTHVTREHLKDVYRNAHPRGKRKP